MLHFERWKIIAIVATCLAGILFALPNFFSKETVAAWPGFMPKRQLALGLDLRGGAHLLLAMDTAELKKDWLANQKEDVRKQLRTAKIGFSAIGASGDALQVRLVKPEETEAALRELRKLIQPIGNAILGTSGRDVSVEPGDEPGLILITPTEPGLQERVANAASASIETVNRRINALGTAESTIVRQGRDRILIQYPGLTDTRQLKELIGKTAKLTFHSVHPSVSAEEAKQTRVPIGYKVYESDERDEVRQGAGYVLAETPVVHGDDLVDAQPSFDDPTNQPIISF